MRRIIYFLATALAMLVVSIKIASAQGSVGVNTKTPNVNAALDIRSLGKQGILIPRLSAEDTLVAPLKSSSLSAKDKGLLFYDTVGLQFLHWNGLRWQAFGKNSEGVGPQGPIGLTGPQGPAGNDGAAGATGPQGPIGLTGAVGPVGPQGPIGLTGPQGPAGNDGAVGATGPQGPIGLTGAAGPIGPQGPIGLTGLNGKTVLNGILDPVAATGDDGDFYINTATNKIFGPKTLGVWAAGVSLIGPAGSFSVTGTIGQTIYHDGTAWKATSNLYNDGTSVGIGTPAVSANKLLIRSANSGTIPFAVQNSTNTNALIEVGDFAGNGLFRGFASSGPTIGFSFNANQTNNSFLLGNFGVGINSPSEKLTVNGNAIILEGNSLKFAEPVGANFTAFKAGNQTADITYTLPSTQGAAGNVLVTDNLGNLSWSSISGLSGGTTNYVPKWASANTLSSTSLLYDNGIGVAIGSNNPLGAILRVNGDEIIFDNNPTGIEITSATSIGSGFAQMVYDASTGATGSPSMSYIFKPRNNSNSGTNTYAEMKFVKVANQDYGFVAFSTLNAASNYAERMRLDAEGRLGIGKSPTQALDVLGNVRFSGALMPNNTAGTSGQVLVSAGTGNVPTWANITGTIVGGVADQTFRHNGATWVASSLLTNDGTYIGIGSNASTAKLNIAPESGLGHAISMYQNGSTTNYWYEGVRMSDGNKYHGYNGLFRGLYSSVDGVYLSASDNKLKKNVNNLDKTLGSVSKLRPVKYHMNEQKDTDMQRIGFIAQEVKEYFPELVEYDESENIHSLNYGSMSVIAIKAIQEQQKIIEGLQTQIEVLQQQVNSLLLK